MSRPAVATLAGLAFFIAYAVVVVSLADYVLATHWVLVAIYFVVVGSVWTYPIIKLMVWASRRA